MQAPNMKFYWNPVCSFIDETGKVVGRQTYKHDLPSMFLLNVFCINNIQKQLCNKKFLAHSWQHGTFMTVAGCKCLPCDHCEVYQLK